ncbi:MAG: lipid-binding SYLF domain-containing protein [Bryobacteraceae bacterium]|nr:lipid-binding SYLF domain-containing protein [Bryobacteraceae bacterium]
MKNRLLLVAACLAAGTSLLVGQEARTAADENATPEKRVTDIRERLMAADTAFRETMNVPEKGIPRDLLAKAHCAVLIPGLKKGAFLGGVKYGKGFITCRGADRAWSAPANVRVEGGSFGLQFGAGETDVFLLVMNEAGADRLLRSEFKLGGEAGLMAGPVGRTVQANTDAFMRAQMLGWSRSRGVFAGFALEGSTLREDRDDNRALYGRDISNVEIVKGGKVAVPESARPMLQTLTRYSAMEDK